MAEYEFETNHVTTNDGFRVTVTVETTRNQAYLWESIPEMQVAVPTAQAAIGLSNVLVEQQNAFYDEEG